MGKKIVFELTGRTGVVPSDMTVEQLARPYKFLVSMYRFEDAETVYATAIANISAEDFCALVAQA